MSPSLQSAVNNKTWAEHEFKDVDFGDKRLNKRSVKIAEGFHKQPNASIPKAMGNWADTQATYRFFKNKRVHVDPMLDSHVEATKERIAEHEIVLLPQDTTYLNHDSHPQTEGLGPIGSNQNNTAQGIILHDTLALTTDGLALGIVDWQTWTRDQEDFGKGKKRKNKPIDEKESNKWLKSYEALAELQKDVPNTTLVSIGDQEADIYEIFERATREEISPEVLIRAHHNRYVDHSEKYLWDFMDAQPVHGTHTIEVPRKQNQPKRQANLAVRFAQVMVKRPKNCATPGMPKFIKVWAVLAEEMDPPTDVEPISWLLITTIAIDSFEDAIEKIRWYMIRWQIELFHKVLKSGCKVEDRQLKKVKRIEKCLIIDAIVAWRILLLTKLGREVPELPCSVVFEEYEWKALYSYIHKTTEMPEKEPTLQEAIRMVAKLGGFLGRKGDGEPGSMTLWRGLHRLNDIAEMWRIVERQLHPRPT